MRRNSSTPRRSIKHGRSVLTKCVSKRKTSALWDIQVPDHIARSDAKAVACFVLFVTEMCGRVIDDRKRFDDDAGAKVALQVAGGQMSQAEIADLYGTSRQYIEQIESAALEKFARGLKRLGLSADLEGILRDRMQRKESYAERAERMSHGTIALNDWRSTHSSFALAKKSGRAQERLSAPGAYTRAQREALTGS